MEMLRAACAGALGDDAVAVLHSMIDAFEDQLANSGKSTAANGAPPPFK